MTPRVEQIGRDLYRIATFHPDYGIDVNQFLIDDEEPFLMHTGFRRMFPVTLEGVAKVIDPSRLRWIGYSHFEPDECAALNLWLERAPQATALCSTVGAMVMLADFADRPPHPLADGEILELGRNRLRFLSTPHFPHGWDAGLFFEESERTLLCSDLFFQPGECPALLKDDSLVERATEALIAGMAGPLANDMPYTPHTDRIWRRLADLAPRTLALMHGSSFHGDGQRALLEMQTVIREKLSTPAIA